MNQRVFGMLIWLGIVGILGAIARFAFEMNFWEAAIIAAVALIANGLFAEWEDRQPGGLFNPRAKDK